MVSRRMFLAAVAVTLTGPAPSHNALVGQQASSRTKSGFGGKSASLFLPADDLKPATADRLPLEWHKQRVTKLQEMLAAEGYEGILLTDRWNLIYFTGLWHTTTERLF